MNHEDEIGVPLDAAAEARVTEALNALSTVEPPQGFVGQVMWRTKRAAIRDNSQRRQARRIEQGAVMAKKVLIGLAAVAAVGLAVAYFSGIPQPDKTEGTIGAAQRYQTEQIKKSDVKVGDPKLQAFLQTDTFDKLVHDKKAMAALASPAVQAALASPAVQQALASPEIAQALAAPAVQQVLGSAAFQQELNAQGVQAALAGPALQQALSNPALIDALASPAFQQAMASPAFQQALASPTFQAALASPALQQALASEGFQQGLAAQGFLQELALQAQGLAASGSTAEQD